MPRILFLSSDTNAPKTVTQLMSHLPGERYETRCRSVRHYLRQEWDLFGVWQLRQEMASFRPDVLHLFGSAAVHTANLLSLPFLRLRPSPALVVSDCEPHRHPRRLRHVARIIASTQAEANRLATAGVASRQVTVIPPGVEAQPDAPPDPIAFRRMWNIPESARLIFAAGRFDRISAMKSAVWAFDVIRQAEPDLHLILVGDGPERARVERFAHAIAYDDYRVRFLGERPDVAGLLTLGEVVWITHEQDGIGIAAEAMLTGKPVVAFGTPELSEVISDGETGLLAPPRDRVRLASLTHSLLEDPHRCRQLGLAVRAVARERFSLSKMVSRHTSVYDDLATSGTNPV